MTTIHETNSTLVSLCIVQLKMMDESEKILYSNEIESYLESLQLFDIAEIGSPRYVKHTVFDFMLKIHPICYNYENVHYLYIQDLRMHILKLNNGINQSARTSNWHYFLILRIEYFFP